MSETRRFKFLGPGGVEIARLLVPPDDAPIDVQILNGNVWGVLELQVIEEKPEEIPTPETPSPEEDTVTITEKGLEALTEAEAEKPRARRGKKEVKECPGLNT